MSVKALNEKSWRFREAGHVQRCHCIPHFGSYDIAQHTFHMLTLMELLHPCPSMNLFRGILLHDMAERWIGDTPCVAKELMPELKDALKSAENIVYNKVGISFPDLTEKDHKWLKALDTIEFLMWCHDQKAMGNQNAQAKIIEVGQWIEREWNKIPKPCQFFIEHLEWLRTSDDIVT